MSPGRSIRSSLAGVNFVFVCAAFLCLPIVAHAGGLGIAALTAIAGLVALICLPAPQLSRMPLWGWSLVLFLVWAFISAYWSPYKHPDMLSNPVKLLIGAALYFCFDRGVKAASLRAPLGFRRFIIGSVYVGLAILLIDLLFPYAVTYLVDPIAEGEHVFYKTGDILMNLGHAVAVYTLILGFIAGSLFRTSRRGVILGIVFIVMLLVAAVSHGLAVGLIGVIAALAAMICARFWPRVTLSGLTCLACLTVLAAPLIGFISRGVSPDLKAKLPISWEHRIEMWSYISAKISAQPLIGHGFDAVRTFGDTYTSRGLEFAYVSLHPHSAGLHIWAETGAVGAVLATITLFLIGRVALESVNEKPELAIPYAGFAAAAITICTVTFGVWQDWWWASLIVTAALRHIICKESKLLSM